MRELRRLQAMLVDWAWAPAATEKLLRNVAQALVAIAHQLAGLAALAYKLPRVGDGRHEDLCGLPPPAPPPLAGAATISAPPGLTAALPSAA
jgi:hypothetical protein